jgi:GNAT superfamily N-acetyltransferase
MPDEIVIRPVNMKDAPELVELSAQLGYSIQMSTLIPRLERIFADPDSAIFGAAGPDGKVVGFVQVFIICNVESEMYAEVMGLVVDQNQRRKGIGKRLMDAVEAWAKEHGLNVVRLRSQTKRQDAHKFYQDIGYQILKSQFTFCKEIN